MDETLAQVVFAFTYFATLFVAGVLWWTAGRSPARRRPESRPFWAWLALGWTLNIAGNVIWAVHDMTTGTVLPPLSWVDALYVARYVCLGVAFWQYPAAWEKRRLLEVGGLLLLLALALWAALYRTEFVNVERSWDQVLGVAIYPVLDVGLIYVLALKWREMPVEPWRRVLLLLLLGALAYSIANGINFCVRMASLDGSSDWATLFWFGCDLFAAAAAIWFARRADR
ncbi:MAG: hypothetical protein JW934_08125 [Anaerolineae bacterium]|nr:hypothetical protein [Anaerolineae bacterium]